MALEKRPLVDVQVPIGDADREVAERVGCDVDAAGNKTVALHRREGSIVPDDVRDRIHGSSYTLQGRGGSPNHVRPRKVTGLTRPGRGATSTHITLAHDRLLPPAGSKKGRACSYTRSRGPASLTLSLDGSDHVKTTTVEAAERGRSPLGAHIRFLMDGPHGNMIHSTVLPGMVGRACHFRTIDEYWYVLSGEGEIWRRAPDGQESITRLTPGVCVDIPRGTAFQYRCTANVALVCTVTALPPWPGDEEAVIVDGPWVPRVNSEPGGQRSD